MAPDRKNHNQQFSASLNDPEKFWSDAAHGIHWDQFPKSILDRQKAPFYRWFADGKLNTCFNALDRHVAAGMGDKTALIYDSPVTKTKIKYTYQTMLTEVSKIAGALKKHGVGKGDRVIIYMPMVPEAVMAMLACARLGAIHSVVFGGFAAAELAARINDAKPKIILSASGAIEGTRIVEYKPLLDHALELAHDKNTTCLILDREFVKAKMIAGRDLDWKSTVSQASPTDCVSVLATDPAYILYTSGTTGHPKGIVRDTGGHAVALNWSMQSVYDTKPSDVFWAASDIGWVVGHSYIVYAPLIFGCTTLLYEGKPIGTPDASAFWRIIEEYQVNILFTAPTAFRAIKKEDPEGTFIKKHNLSSLRALFLAGERSDSATLDWAEGHLKVPVIDHWWQTETGWAIVANCLGIEKLAVKHGSPTKPVPGWDVQVLDEGGHPVPANHIGSLVCKLPLPPGSLPTLWQDDQRFIDSYLKEFPGYYKTADAGKIDEDGYVYVLARTDDVVNVSGHRLATGVLEESLAGLEAVAECAVFGTYDEIKGEVPVGLLVMKSNCNLSEAEITKLAVEKIREDVGPVASFKTAIVVKRLPKTRSGKILRSTMKKISDGEAFKIPATIDDPLILDEIRADLLRHGFPQGRIA